MSGFGKWEGGTALNSKKESEGEMMDTDIRTNRLLLGGSVSHPTPQKRRKRRKKRTNNVNNKNEKEKKRKRKKWTMWGLA